jgi:small-conductance mechanosensitive channel
LTSIVASIKRLAAFLIVITVSAVGAIYIFDLFVAQPINLPTLLQQSFDVIIIVAFWLTAIFLLLKLKNLLTPHVGVQVATALQFVSLIVSFIVMSFGVLETLGVSPQALLTSAGIISITVGLIISTFVGGILSGALVFTTYKFKVGDDVLVNNVPGRIIDMTALVTRIRTDTGMISIPNNAIASGGVIITAAQKPPTTQETRLHYIEGDRVITSYKYEEGIVKEITAYHTRILLDSGKEIIFLNNSVLSGAVPIAKIASVSETK